MAKREFDLDLTSVCVATGVLQLPMKMQEYFVSGDLPAIVDGEELKIRFTEPRRLSGFQQHFERRGLRCNDKMQFQVEMERDVAVGLLATSIKRERNKPIHTPSETASRADQRSEADKQTHDAITRRHESSWGSEDLGGQVRAVRRVRIEGSAPSPVGGHSRYPTSNGDVRQPDDALTRTHALQEVAGRHHDRHPAPASEVHRWAPLDGVSVGNTANSRPDDDFAETTVREVRRKRETHDDHVIGADAVPTSPVEDAAFEAPNHIEDDLPPLYSHGDEVVADRSEAPVAAVTDRAERASDEDVRDVPVGETAPLTAEMRTAVSTPRIPVPRNTAAGAEWNPTPASELNPVEPSGGQRQPRLIEERELVPVRARYEPAAPHVTAQVRPDHAPHDARSDTTARQSQLQHAEATGPTIDDMEFGGEYLPAGRSLEAALRSKQQERLAFSDATTATPIGAGSEGDEGVGSAGAPSTAEVALAAPKVEDDLRLVESYLSRPNTPAIVRSEVIAAELGIDDQRSERALERLSEDRDRVSRIRKGAYMVKSIQPGHAHRL